MAVWDRNVGEFCVKNIEGEGSIKIIKIDNNERYEIKFHKPLKV